MNDAPAPLTPDELAVAFKKLPGWREEGGHLTKTFVHPSFAAALLFVNAVGTLAEKVNHHPDIDVRFRKVRLALTTHDAGGKITRRDTGLAGAIEQFLG